MPPELPSDNTTPKPSPLPPVVQTSHHEKSRFGWIFLGFMLLVGGGILATKFSEVAGSQSRATPVAFASSKTVAKGGANATGFVTATPEPQIKVYMTGEVRNPGIYTMQRDDRIVDALETAGGVTEQADISQLDLAQRVRDEMRINIPKLVATPVVITSVTNSTPTSIIISNNSNPTAVSLPNNPANPTHPTSGSSSKIGPESGVKINLNTADATELQRLPGIGATLAQRLVDYRGQHGSFHNTDDLHHVQGFTKTVVDKIKDLVTF